MSKYPSTNITYAGIEDKGLTIQVKDSNSPKTRWVIWKKDRDTQQDSEPFTDIQNKKIGETFGVQYGEKEKSFTGREGNTITYTERTIYRILPLVATPTSSEAKSPNTSQSMRSQRPETDWDQIAVGKCQTQFLAAYIQAGNTFQDAKLQVTQARKLAELVVYGTQQEELPTINQDDDPAGDFNPMVNELPIEAFGDDIPY